MSTICCKVQNEGEKGEKKFHRKQTVFLPTKYVLQKCIFAARAVLETPHINPGICSKSEKK